MAREFDIKNASVDDIIREIKARRVAAETTAASFLILLHDIEEQREDVWKTAGIDSFDVYLQSHAICNSARYREFVAGLSKVGRKKAIVLGEGATVAAGRFRDPTPEKVERLADRAEKFEAVHGTKASEQTAQTWVRDIEPREPRVVQQFSELGKLRAENQQLKAQIRERERRIRELEQEVAKLKKTPKKTKAA